MKLKHFILALVAMLSCFTFTANAQVAKVGNTKYATIDEAIANWTNGTTLTLMADVTLSDVIKLNSNEHHILNLGTYTMTAGVKKNSILGYTYEEKLDAIEIVNKGRTSASYALTVNADATNPGGITATGKSCIYYKKSDSTKDRPIILINNGVFNGSYSINSISNGNTNCPQIWINGGVFNGNVNLTKNLLQITGGTFHGSINCTGDVNAYRLISGGRFKSWQFMTNDNKNGSYDKFGIATSKDNYLNGNYNVGVYIDAEGYLVVGGAVIKELSPKYKAVVSYDNFKTTNQYNNFYYYLAQSSAATYGLFYEDAEMAIKKHGAANVTVWEKPAVTIPENVTGDATVVEEIKNNTALKGYIPENLPTGAELEIELKSVGTTIVYEVAPMANGTKVEPTQAITFRLPVPASVTETYAKVYHDGELMGIYAIQGEVNAKYVEISSADFSEYTVEPTIVVAKIGEQGYETFTEALEATKTMTGDVTVEIYDKVTFNQPLTGNYTSINFVGKEADAEMYLDVQGYTTATGKKVSFTDLKLSKSVGGHIANAGFMNVAFGIYDVKKVSYNNCTFLNGACASSGEVTFNGCAFYRSHDRYGLWAYGAPSVTVDGCTFADIRGIKLWDEGKQKLGALTVKNTDFSAVTDKPAIVLTSGKSVVLAGNTYNADKGTFELDLDGNPNGTPVTSDVAPVCVNDNGACGVLVDGKIYTTVAQAAEVATSGSTVTLLHNSAETIALPMGVTLNKNNFEAAGVTVAVPVAKIGDVEYATLAAAVEAAQAGAEIVVVANVADVTVDVTKNLTISGAATLNNVGINANGADALTVKGLTFTGNSWINSGTAEALTVSGVTATVAPNNATYTNSRSAFISLGRSEQQTLALTVENCNITVTSSGPDAILGWAAITKATITGNVIKCSDNGYFTNADAIKFMSIADGAEFEIKSNEIWSNYNGIVFGQNTTRANAYSVYADANKFVGGADHIWIEVSGANTVHATVNATSANTVNGNAFTINDIKYRSGVIKNWTSYAGVDVVTDANGKVIGGTLASFSNAESVAEGYEIGTNGAVGKASVAEVNGVKYASFAEAAAAAQAGSEIKLLANIEGDITVPANVTLNGNDFAISGGILAEGDITFAGITTAADFDAKVVNTAVNIPAGASLQLTGSARLVIGHGATFNITGTIEDAKTADKATLVPSLKIAAGASITGNGVTFNVNNAYIVANANTTSKNSNANGTLDFNINNSIWEQTGVLAFYVPTSGMDPVVNFELKNSVLTTTSHLVFAVTKGEIIFDNSNVNGESARRQIENRSTMTIKNGAVVYGAVATSSNAKNPGTLTVDNATYNVTGEFSGSDLGTGTLIIKKGANVSAGSITKANIQVDASDMVAGDEINLTANLSKLAGTLEVINNDKLEASIVDGKVVLAAKPAIEVTDAEGNVTYLANTKGFNTSNVTLKLIANVDDYNLNLNKATGVVLDLNGFTFAKQINLNNGAELTIKDTSAEKTGKVIVDKETNNTFAAIVIMRGSLTIESGTIETTGTTGAIQATHATLNINGGKFVSQGNGIELGTWSLLNRNLPSTVTMAGGEIVAEGYGIKDSDKYEGTEIAITGGKINSKGDCLGVNTDVVTVTVSGGTFSKAVEEEYCAEGFVPAENADGTFGVEKAPVASINGTKYTSLAEAVAAAQAGDEIVLIADVNTTDGVVITDKNLTIDLNGKTYTVTEGASTNNRNFKINGTSVVTVKNGTMVAEGEYSSGAYGTIRTEGTANVTLTGLKLYNYRGNGLNIKACAGTTVTIENTEIYANYGGGIESAGGTIVVNDGVTVKQEGMYTAPYNSMAISVNGGGKVTVNGGTFSTECITAEEANNQGTSHGPWVAGVLNSGGTLIINGGTFSNDNFGENSLATYARGAILADTGAKIEINGGTFNALNKIIDIQNNLGDASKNPSAVLVGGAFSSNPTNGNTSNCIKVKDGCMVVENNGVWNVVKAAAKIGEVEYATLAVAVAAVQEGETITILAGTYSEGTIKLPATLKNVTIKGESVARSTEGAVLKDMTISAADGNAYNYEGLTFDGITFDNSRILLTGWRNGDEIIKNLAVTNCTFKNLNDNTNTAPIHINKEASEPVNGFTFTNNVIDGATGGSKSGIYAQVTGAVKVENNIINNVSFRPYVIQVTTDDGIADNFTVKGNTFSGSAVGRAQGLGNNAEGTDNVNLVVSNNIFKGITQAQQICYWNFNAEKTTADLSGNYYDIDILANPSGIYYNSAAQNTDDLIEKGIFPIYKELNEDGTINTASAYYPPVVMMGENGYQSVKDALAAAKAENLTEVVITIVGENTADTKDDFGLYEETAFNNVTIKQDNGGKAYYFDCIHTGKRAVADGQFVFDGVNIVIAGQYITQCKTVLKNNSIVKRTNDVKNFIYYADMVVEPGSKYEGIIDDILGGSITVDGGKTDGTYNDDYGFRSTYFDVRANQTFTVKNGAYALINSADEIGRITLNGTMNVEASKVDVFNNIAMGDNAAINLDIKSLITAKEITGAGAINVDATGVEGAVTVIEANMSGFTGTINVEGGDYEITEEGLVITKSSVAKIGETKYATLEAAIAAATEDANTIKLVADLVIDSETYTIPAGKAITLDLNGKTITGTENATGSFALITNKGNLTITGNGKITLTATNNRGWNAYSSVISNQPGGKLTVENGTIEHLGGTDMAYAIDNLTNGKGTYAETVINGGTIKSTYRAIRQFLNGVEAQNILTVNGGTIEGANKSIWMQDPSANANTGKLTVSADAVLNGDVYLFVTAGSTEWPVEVSIAAAALKDGAQVVTGNVPAQYVVENVNGTWGVSDAVASVDGVGYTTLAEAVAAAQDGDIVTLHDNIALDATVTVAGKSITLDLNGKTVSGTCNASQSSLVYVENNAALTVKDSSEPSTGKLTFAQGSSNVGWTVDVKGAFTLESGTIELTGNWSIGYAVDVRPNSWGTEYTKPSVFTMNGGNIVSSDGAVRVASSSADTHQNVSASFVMNGGLIDAAWDGVFIQQSNAIYDVLNFTMNGGAIESDLNPVRVYGPAATGYVDGEDCMSIDFNAGTMTYTGSENYEWVINAILRVGGGSSIETILASGNITASATFAQNNSLPAGYVWEANGEVYTAVAVVAEVDGVQYGSLQTAIDAAEGNTVTVLANIALTESVIVPAGKEVILDLNGKTISAAITEQLTKSFAAITNKGTLTVKDDTNSGKISVSYAGNTFGYGIGLYTISNEAGVLNIEGGTIENTTTVSGSMYDAIDNNSTLGETVLNISGGEVKCEAYIGVRQFANNTTYDNIVNVTGGMVVGGNTSIWMQNPGSNQPKATIAISGDAKIEGRLLAGTSAGFEYEVTGGTFNTDVTDFCMFGYECKANAYGTYGVQKASRIESLELIDGQFTKFENDHEITVGELTYKRTFPTFWNPFYVPFEVPVSQLIEQGFEVAYINGVRRDDTNYDGELDEFVMEVIYIHGGNADGSGKTLKANYPYFIKAKNGVTTMEIKLENVTLFKAGDKSFDCTTMTEKFELIGNNSTKHSSEFQKNMYIVASPDNKTAGWGAIKSGSELKPFRFYMNVTSREDSDVVVPMEYMSISVRGEMRPDGTTFIYDVEMDAEQTVDYIYDLQGRRVLEPQKGNLYIINGKKVIF